MSKDKLNAERFLQLELELDKFRKLMTEASDIILDKDVSEYPIFVAHQQEMEIGMLIYEDKKGVDLWKIHASTFEEFVNKQIIFGEKIEDFKANSKDVNSYVCVFVLSELGAQFIFLPRK